jgi:hypothetical protein
MPASPDFGPAGSWESFAAKVREASRCGKTLPLDEVWQGTEDEFLKLKQSQTGDNARDIELIREDGRAYLYSERHMTRPYAEAAARAGCKDVCYAIAQTVRGDSRTYPRPTELAVFCEAPFLFSEDMLDQAVKEILRDPQYADIRVVRSSDGSKFLFSSSHMDPVHAESLAEWIAVGHLRNP